MEEGVRAILQCCTECSKLSILALLPRYCQRRVHSGNAASTGLNLTPGAPHRKPTQVSGDLAMPTMISPDHRNELGRHAGVKSSRAITFRGMADTESRGYSTRNARMAIAINRWRGSIQVLAEPPLSMYLPALPLLPKISVSGRFRTRTGATASRNLPRPSGRPRLLGAVRVHVVDRL